MGDLSPVRDQSPSSVTGDAPTPAAFILPTLQALLARSPGEDPFAPVFGALHAILEFEQALALEQRDEGFDCVAAESQGLVGLHVPDAAFLRAAAAGEISVTRSDRDLDLREAFGDAVLAPEQHALGLPLRTEDRRGVLVLVRAEGREPFGPPHLAAVRDFAPLGSTALAVVRAERTQLEVERISSRSEEMHRAQANAARDCEVLRTLIDALPVRLTLYGPDGQLILANAAADQSGPIPELVPIGSRRADLIDSGRQPNDAAAVGSDTSIVAEEQVVTAAGERTLLTWRNPLRVGNDKLLLCSSVDITERKQFERQLTRLAYLDDLTGLANRTFIQEHIEGIISQGERSARFAVAFIDIDNFKHVNDYYSHAIGDMLLASAARRMSSLIAEKDIIARISGDEFLLLVDPVASEEQLRVTIDRILDELKQPFYIEGFEVLTSASIGVSVYPDHGRSYEALRRHADNAMYRAKTGAKGRAIFFDVEMGRTLTARMELEQRLRLAIRDGRFCCAFQPKVDIRTQEVVGFETLIRWRDDKGIISPPGVFVELATELGLMDTITHFVLAEAAKAIDRLDSFYGSGTTISINVAAKQAGDLHFMRSLIDALKATGCPDRIIIELTEDTLVAGSQFQEAVLPSLRALGVKVSIDDFGTGYSSLSGLADITADEIKIDRSFITAIHERPRNQSVLRAIESLGRALGMTIVAEGIESFEELAYLQAATQIRYGQGFYFARPFLLEDFTHSKHRIFEERADATSRPQEQRRQAYWSRNRGFDHEDRGSS
jgi:c-di-GMP phosphodiesterase Gmr